MCANNHRSQEIKRDTDVLKRMRELRERDKRARVLSKHQKGVTEKALVDQIKQKIDCIKKDHSAVRSMRGTYT